MPRRYLLKPARYAIFLPSFSLCSDDVKNRHQDCRSQLAASGGGSVHRAPEWWLGRKANAAAHICLPLHSGLPEDQGHLRWLKARSRRRSSLSWLQVRNDKGALRVERVALALRLGPSRQFVSQAVCALAAEEERGYIDGLLRVGASRQHVRTDPSDRVA